MGQAGPCLISPLQRAVVTYRPQQLVLPAREAAWLAAIIQTVVSPGEVLESPCPNSANQLIRSGFDDQTSGTSHADRDAALGAGALGAGTAVGMATHHRHEEPQRDNYAPAEGRSFPLGGNGGATTGSGSGSNDPSGQIGTYHTGGVPGPATSGPHSSILANKADSHVDSDRDGSWTVEQPDVCSNGKGYGSSAGIGPAGMTYGSDTGPNASSTHQGDLAHDAALGAGAGAGLGAAASSGYGPDSWQHEHGRLGHDYVGDPCETAHASADTHPLHTSGPHLTDTANRLDPHVGSGSTGGLKLTAQHGHSHGHQGAHRGEEAALASGAGLGGHEGLPGSAGSGSTGNGSDTLANAPANTSKTGKTAGPHKSNILNKLDPRVDSDLSKQQGTASTSSYSDPAQGHRSGKEAGLADAGGVVAHEAGKHHHNKDHSSSTTATGLGDTASTTSTSDPYSSSSSRDAHYGRDAGVVGIGGTAAYEAKKHHHGRDRPDTTSGLGSSSAPVTASTADPCSAPSGNRDHHDGRDVGLAGVSGTAAYEVEKHHHSNENLRTTSGTGDSQNTSSGVLSDPHYTTSGQRSGITSGTSSGIPPRNSSARSTTGTGNDHHLGRDAALGAGTGGIAAEAGHHHGQPTQSSHMPGDATGRETTGYDQAGTELAGSSPQPTTGQGYGDQTKQHHYGRDAGLVGAGGAAAYEAEKHRNRPSESIGETRTNDTHQSGHHYGRYTAAAGGAGGAGALAGHELSEKDEKKMHKEQVKEEKAMQKEEKKHEKAIEKEEKQHEKGEKKHGGLLGLLHRDKPNKELQVDEVERQARLQSKTVDQGAYPQGATSQDPLAEKHGSPAGVHDGTIIGSGRTTHEAYEQDPNKHNKLHKVG